MITVIPEDKLDTPAKGVDFLADVDRQQKLLEQQLAETKSLRHKLETEFLPSLFDRFEQPEATSNSGAKAEKKLYVTGSLPKVGEKDTPEEAAENERRREAAIAQAVAYNWEPFIKTTVTVEFDKGDRAKAIELYNRLRRESNSAVIEIDEGIHHTTLQAQVRKRIREGKAVALDVLNVSAGPAVKLVQKKDRN